MPELLDDSFTIAYEDEHLLVVDKGPGLVVHPARGHREGTLSQLLAPHGRRRRSRAGGDRAPPGPRHLRSARRRALGGGSPAAAGGARASGASNANTSRWCVGRPPARTGTIEAPIGRDPQVRTRMAVGGDAPARGAHALHARARAAGDTAAARAAGDRPHPPDPRPHAGHRPPRRRRSRVRRCRACSAWSASSCTPRASPSSTPSAGERVEVRSPLPGGPRASALARAERAILSGSIRTLDPCGDGSRPCPEHDDFARSVRVRSTARTSTHHT